MEANDTVYPQALTEGAVLGGQYVIESVLGQGGFGITYRAVDQRSGETVAVKEFFPDMLAYRENTTVISYPGDRTDNFEFGRSNFLQEAQTLQRFTGSENIVGIRSYFEENGTAYFVMDYVEGQSFDAYLKQNGGKISFDEACRILFPVMDALETVHGSGIIHRDVTPDNIYITNDGAVRLLDFGAARYSLGDKSRSLDVILKHGFAPKEQYTRHGRQGPYTDVYSLAATFYFALTGRKPPDSIDRLEEDDLIPPCTLGVQMPESAEDALLRALSVSPADRFQSMREFREALSDDGSDNATEEPELLRTVMLEPPETFTRHETNPAQNVTVQPSPPPPVQKPAETVEQIEEPAGSVQQRKEPPVNKQPSRAARFKPRLFIASAVGCAVVIGLICWLVYLKSKPSPGEWTVDSDSSANASVIENSIAADSAVSSHADDSAQTDSSEDDASSAETYAEETEPQDTTDAQTVSDSGTRLFNNILTGSVLCSMGDAGTAYITDDYEHLRIEGDAAMTLSAGRYLNLFWDDGDLYYLQDNRVVCSSFSGSKFSLSGASVPGLSAFDGSVTRFCMDDRFFYVYIAGEGRLVRVKRSSGSVEESLDMPEMQFVIADGMLYFTESDYTGSKPAVLYKYAADDFSAPVSKLKVGNYRLSDPNVCGKYIYLAANESADYMPESDIIRVDSDLDGDSMQITNISAVTGNMEIANLNVFDSSNMLYTSDGTLRLLHFTADGAQKDYLLSGGFPSCPSIIGTDTGFTVGYMCIDDDSSVGFVRAAVKIDGDNISVKKQS